MIMTDRVRYELTTEMSPIIEGKFKFVWETLKAINVNEHTEKKGNLTYLSWAWAYATMMNHFPTFNYRFDPEVEHPDGTVTVNVQCEILLGGIFLQRSMWLPVMDFRNNSIANPDSMAINTAKMRCLTKCISMYGLGAYIYAGEDLPEATADEEEKKPAPKKAKPEPKAKVTPIKGKKSEQKPVEEDFYCEDDEAAEEYANFMIQTATEMHSDTAENLIEFWKINVNATNYLKENFPDAYELVKDAFSELKANIKGGNK